MQSINGAQLFMITISFNIGRISFKLRKPYVCKRMLFYGPTPTQIGGLWIATKVTKSL